MKVLHDKALPLGEGSDFLCHSVSLRRLTRWLVHQRCSWLNEQMHTMFSDSFPRLLPEYSRPDQRQELYSGGAPGGGARQGSLTKQKEKLDPSLIL